METIRSTSLTGLVVNFELATSSLCGSVEPCGTVHALFLDSVGPGCADKNLPPAIKIEYFVSSTSTCVCRPLPLGKNSTNSFYRSFLHLWTQNGRPTARVVRPRGFLASFDKLSSCAALFAASLIISHSSAFLNLSFS